MEPVSIASFTLASILASLPANNENTQPTSQAVITTHISPAIVGQWEIDLDSELSADSDKGSSVMDSIAMRSDSNTESTEPRVVAGTEGGVIEQNERRIVKVKPNTNINNVANSKQSITASAAQSDQCRELYNFGSDNQLWTVSDKEWTYGHYLITHLEKGLPIIAIKTIYDNNEIDCSGNQVDQSGEILMAFLKHEGNKMQWCADPEGEECFVNFHRVLP
ncbi:hypothetical protein [Psychrobacter jeotgali]|uniref:hypothetical protein n=1 Tax=Psychrobacter jeotgali TaxID=179010 RepID=UPI00191B867F|nr:hypothetical protein [Psychrobacter jeotgali]